MEYIWPSLKIPILKCFFFQMYLLAMEDKKGPDTRRRSRSKTPFVLRSQCNKESCTDADHGHASVIKVPEVM